MDPYAVLGLQAGAPPEEATRAYRRLAKRWHPDRAGPQAGPRMAELNLAFDLLRAVARSGRPPPAPPRSGPGSWLPDAMRRALGRELLLELDHEEAVELVTPAATWASPSTLLALTDRRLLWLLDDAVSHRVRSLRLGDVEHAEHALMWPRRRRARLRVQQRYGRRWEFADLRPVTAASIVQRLGATRRDSA